MTTATVIETLKHDADKDAAFNAVCHVFALRKRARHMVSLRALTKKMEAEGFKYSTEQYASILKRLATLGVGRLETDAKGKVRALRDIKLTLQSIGKAALGERLTVARRNARNVFTQLPVAAATKERVETLWKAPERRMNLRIRVPLGGKLVDVEVPKGLSKEEIAVFISKFLD